MIWCGTQKGLSKLERTSDRLALRSVDIGIPNEYPEQRFSRCFDVFDQSETAEGNASLQFLLDWFRH